jgi:AcrR family transcriptional regulator
MHDEKQGLVRRGRPQQFNRELALREAMRLFWDRGYEGTYFDDLIAAMGIGPSTFYNSFGNKEKVYREAVEYYIAGPTAWFQEILDRPGDTRTAIERLVVETAVQFTSGEYPAGCMISLAGTHVAPGLNSIRDMFIDFRAQSEVAIAKRLAQGVDAGDLAPDTNVVELAAYFGTVFRGMAVQARDGKSLEQILGIGRIAMRAWPAG